MTDDVFWLEPLESLKERLGAGADGLSATEIPARLRHFGPNRDQETVEKGLLRLILRRTLEPMSLLLVFAALVSAGTGDAASAGIILVILGASIALDLFQEGRAKRAADALRQSVAVDARVKRDGLLIDIPVEMVVPGDVFVVDVGDIIPADAVLLSSSSLTVDEAALTGEPYGVVKSPNPVTLREPSEATNALFRGSVVITGTATALAVATGQATLFGKAAHALNTAQALSPFELDLHRLGYLIARAAAVLVLAVLAANIGFGRPLIESLMFSVALAVGLTPELLPMITTVTLSRGALRMAKKQVIVKRLSAIHDLGAMDVLCTDKTGTLTSAKIILNKSLNAQGEEDPRIMTLAAIAAQLGGDKTTLDLALVSAAPDASYGWFERSRYPFDYQRRFGAVLAGGPKGQLLIVKGAPEAVLTVCSSYEGRTLDDVKRKEILDRAHALASDGYRAIAVATRPWTVAIRDPTAEDERDLDFEGLCTFADPLKESATLALQRLKALGVRVVILSGDDPTVVARLGALVGLNSSEVITGTDIQKLSLDALAVKVRDINLFARLSPDQKVIVVNALRKEGKIVGFMGDGVNDAPGIKAADIGLSVDGATGVARAAADMILLESDLSVVADGIEEGRQTFANILKYVRMGASSNFGNMLSMAAAAFFLPFLPMLATQILLNNLLYDLSEIGIPFDRVGPEVIAEPQRWSMASLSRFALVMGPLSSCFDLLTFASLHLGFGLNVEAFRTGWFIESIATQVLVIFIIRSRVSIFKDYPHWILAFTTVSALGLALAIPLSPFSAMLGFAALPANVWITISIIVVAYLIAAEVIKGFAMRQ
ncbi:MAG: magnesium-translocating P-type ATPase [Alphaproteobacteria bacterium]